jgi:centromere protein B
VWFKQTAAVGVPIDGTIIRAKAVEIADRLNVEFNPSNGWIDRFRRRTGLVLRTINGESQSVNLTEAEVWKTEHLPHLLEGYRPCVSSALTNVGHSLPFTQQDIRCQGKKCHIGKLRKDRITVLVVASMDGSEKLPILVIGRSEKPHSFKNIKSFPCKYRHKKMAWMTCTLFEEFLQTLIAKMAAKNRNILLFIDNYAAHPKNVAHLSKVYVEILPPNMT